MNQTTTARLAVLTATVLWSPHAGAQSPPKHPGHYESPGDAPAAHRSSESSPPAAVARNGNVSVQVNVDAEGNNIVGDAANEPSLAIDPTNPSRVAVGWRQFDSVESNFREAGWAYSTDAGQTWTFPGVLEEDVFRSDPVLDYDSDGNLYYYSLGYDFGCDMFKSTNGGQTWESVVSAFGGDKQWMTIDRTSGPGSGYIYASWSGGGDYSQMPYTRSTDGGFTFEGPYVFGILYRPIWGTMTVGPDGTVFIVGSQAFGISRGAPIVLRSTDAASVDGAPTWSVSLLYPALQGVINHGTTPNPSGLLGQLWIAANHAPGPGHGDIYVAGTVTSGLLWNEERMEMRFIRSTDNGETWSSFVRINDDPPGSASYQWFGTMSVAPNGRIDAIWNDARHDEWPAYPTYSEVYYAYSHDRGANWSVNIPVSPPFNHQLGYPQQQKLGDYYDMISDEAAANLAYAATFNGEQDIWFVRLGDCNGNGVHDGLDLIYNTSLDIDENDVPDECQDCDSDGVTDPDEIAAGTSQDCNENLLPDECDIALGLSQDENQNGIPDDCELPFPTCAGDMDCDWRVDFDDIDPFVEALTHPAGEGWPHDCPWLNADCNQDGNVTFNDIDPFVARIGATCP